MSIIADALKKAQEKRLERPDTSEMFFSKPPAPSLATTDIRLGSANPLDKTQISPPGIPLSGPRRRNSFVVIAAIALIAVGAILASAIFRSRSEGTPGKIAELSRETGSPSAENNVISVYKKDPAANEEPSAPTRSYISPARQKNLSLPAVSGIMYSPRNPQAIVNGILVSEGSVVDGFVLMQILPDNIRVRRGETEYQINLR